MRDFAGRQLHEVRIQPRSSGNWDIFLYFELDTFRHVLSLYQLKVQPFLARNIDESARQADSYWRLREEFADFQTSEGVSVPHAYKLVLTYDSSDRPFITEWNFAVTQVRHNQDLEPAAFTVR
jgi:hypothetical protein